MYYKLVIYSVILILIGLYLTTRNKVDSTKYLHNIIKKQELKLLKLKYKIKNKINKKDKDKKYKNKKDKINKKGKNKKGKNKNDSIEEMSNLYDSDSSNNTEIMPIYHQQPQLQNDPVYVRDQKVLYDRLYPPLARTERPQFDLLMNYINSNNGIYNINTRGPPDTFRQIGYLTPVNDAQTIDSTLILYGRAKYPNSDMGEFYVSSSNKISDIKIPLNEYNANVRKITDIPSNINIRGNILNGQYNFTELPKANLDYPYI